MSVVAGRGATSPQSWRSRAWAITGALSITETVSWGVLYYAFAVLLTPMQRELGWSTTHLTGAFSLGLLVSGLVGIPVGRFLDRHSPRSLMTLGSIAAGALVLCWSQVEHLAAWYALWAAIGLVMACVLYEPALVVLATWFGDPRQRRLAMTAMTLVAGLASTIFMPLTQFLVEQHGWRDALVILALALAAITVPLHAITLRPAPRPALPAIPVAVGEIVRTPVFRRLAAGYFLANAAGIAVTILAIPVLLQRGVDPSFAALAVGLIGFAQIPGRILFAFLAPTSRVVLVLIGAGIAVFALAGQHAGLLVAGLIVLGMGNGMTTLARATEIADRYGTAAYGSLSSRLALVTTFARAAGPIAGAALAALAGYQVLLWALVAVCMVAGAVMPPRPPDANL
jgi:MFS family permease